MTKSNNFASRLLALSVVAAALPACSDDPCIDDGFNSEPCENLTGGVQAGEGTGSSSSSSSTSTTTSTTTTGSTSSTESESTTESTSETGETGDPVKVCQDKDGDGQGDPNNCQESVDPVDGFVDNEDDCDDDNPDVKLGAAANEAELCTADVDGDGFGDMNIAGTDCDDQNAHAFPGAAENEPDPTLCAQDVDEDGWGSKTPSGGDTVPGHDCDDNDANATPKTASGQGCFEPLTVDLGPDFNVKTDAVFDLNAATAGGTEMYGYTWNPVEVLVEGQDSGTPKGKLKNTTVVRVSVEDQITGLMATDDVRVFVEDAPIDLLDMCPAENFNVEIGTLSEPDWRYDKNNTRACQHRNNRASGLMCNFGYDEFVFRGEMYVENTPGNPDDDWIGFAWAADATLDDYYVFTWKRNYQLHDDCEGEGFQPGMRVKRVYGSTDELGCYDIIGEASTTHSRLLMGHYDYPGQTDQPWVIGERYSFELTVTEDSTYVKIFGANSASPIAEFPVIDGEDPLDNSGKFGGFDFSQDAACFENFTVAAPN